MRILIVDDEEPARRMLKLLLAQHTDCEVVGEASDGFDGFQKLKELKPDLVFLDVQMPRLTGLEMLELVENPPAVVFATAYEQYAVQAFDRNAADYLVKPYGRDRLARALDRVRSRIAQGTERGTPSPEQGVLRTLAEEPEVLQRIAVKWKGKVHVIPVEHIAMVESDGDYVKLHTGEGVFLKELTMKRLEASLPPGDYVRVHRSALVRVDRIESVEAVTEETWNVKLRGGLTTRASSEGRRTLRRVLGI